MGDCISIKGNRLNILRYLVCHSRKDDLGEWFVASIIMSKQSTRAVTVTDDLALCTTSPTYGMYNKWLSGRHVVFLYRTRTVKVCSEIIIYSVQWKIC